MGMHRIGLVTCLSHKLSLCVARITSELLSNLLSQICFRFSGLNVLIAGINACCCVFYVFTIMSI